MSSEWRYMPILKWKQGEQLALRNLTPEQWKGVTPLIELQPIDAAPETSAIKAKMPDYLSKVAEKIIKTVPGDHTICIDTCYFSTGYPMQISLLIAVCSHLKRLVPDRNIVPVLHGATLESLDLLSASSKEFLSGQNEVVLRIRTDQADALQVAPSINAITSLGIKKSRIHILIDQFSLVNCQDSDCFNAVKPYLKNAIGANCASVTVGGGSFPMNLMGMKQGVLNVSRVEWGVWNLLKKDNAYSGLRYADYTVTNPNPLPDIDATKMNPSIAIRYASGAFWKVYKGRGFKSGVTGEYRGLCKLLIKDPKVYSGENFSYGDRQYMNAANGNEKNGNPSSWRKEATSHHIALTISSL